MLDPGLTVAIVDQLSPYPDLWDVQARGSPLYATAPYD